MSTHQDYESPYDNRCEMCEELQDELDQQTNRLREQDNVIELQRRRIDGEGAADDGSKCDNCPKIAQAAMLFRAKHAKTVVLGEEAKTSANVIAEQRRKIEAQHEHLAIQRQQIAAQDVIVREADAATYRQQMSIESLKHQLQLARRELKESRCEL